jgi:hypothetical protein
MTPRVVLLLCAIGLLGCAGEAGPADAGSPQADAGQGDAGLPIRYTRYTKRAEGLPPTARLTGAAVLDGVLYVASSEGLHGLPAADTRWLAQTLTLPTGAQPTSLQRVDQALLLTAAGPNGGGLYRKTVDSDWAPVASAPTAPTWAMVRKSAEWLLATSDGLYVAPSPTGPWTRRGGAATAPFTGEVPHFVAAPQQQKMFAAGATGGLFESADLGATWVASAPRGTVNALAASGAFVFVDVAMDGQLRSDNYGNTFRPAPAPVSGLLSFSTAGASIWATTNAGIQRSDDNGVTWQNDSDGLPAGTSVRRLFFAGGYVVADTADGPYITQRE